MGILALTYQIFLENIFKYFRYTNKTKIPSSQKKLIFVLFYNDLNIFIF